MDKITLIIPCYFANQYLINLTTECIYSLRNDKIDEIIVVDDGSPLPPPDFAREVTLITLPQNGGYATAVNAGLEGADGDFLIICNNDIEFIQPGWLDHLLKPLKEGYGISSIRTTEPDGWTVTPYYEENAKFGSLWAMTRDTYDTLGSLDERFGKGYGEDLDYWHRARNAGIRIVKNHNGLAEHLGKATFKITDPDNTSFNDFIFAYHDKWPNEHRIFLFDRNQIIGFNKWELEDMSDEDKAHYCEKELTIEQLRDIWRLKNEN
jgi:N-acetylglucosaminyl-diphospho-decaprenol L-rhamnosyltransferase